RARLDAVLGADADRGDRRRLGHRRRRRRARHRAGDRLLPGAGNSVRTLGFWLGGGGGGAGLAATGQPGPPALRGGPADRGGGAAGHRRVERLHLLAAGRLRQRREVADLSAPVDSRADAESRKTKGFGAILRLLGQKSRNTWRALTSMGTALVLLCLLA